MASEDSIARRRELRRERAGFALRVGIGMGAVADFLFVPMLCSFRDADAIVAMLYAGVGLIGAQLGLHAIWCVFSPQKRAKKLASGARIAALLLGAWALGLPFAHTGDSPLANELRGAVLPWLLALPLLAIAMQLPLWVARSFFRWRIFHRCDPGRRSPLEPLGLRDILLATGALAVALSSARVAVLVAGSPGGGLVLLVGIAMVFAAVSLLTTLPLLVATLRARWLGTSLPMLLATYYPAVVIASGLFAVQQGGVTSAEMIAILMLAASFVGALTGGLVIARRLGYRLYWGRRQKLGVRS